jgi:hypothetical protein
MNEREARIIIDSNLPKLVSLMVTVQKGNQVDVFCDASGKSVSFSKPSGEANIKLCSVSAPDLEGTYGLRQKGNLFVNDDGEEVSQARLASYLTQFITNAKDGGDEWGTEFKLASG